MINYYTIGTIVHVQNDQLLYYRAVVKIIYNRSTRNL